MSVLHNIQGSLTQTQHAAELAQQQADQARIQQALGENKARDIEETRKNSVKEQEDVDLSRLQDGLKDGGKEKNKKRKKILPPPGDDEDGGASNRFGGLLINTLA